MSSCVIERKAPAAALLAFALLAASSGAYAQSSWIVVEVREGGTTDGTPTVARATGALKDRGLQVIDGQTAAREIEHKHSRAPVRLQPEELERLDAALRTLADHLASESLPEARAALEAVERLTPDARDYLNRQVNRARRRFHTCLLAAHLFAKEGYDEDAFQQVHKCARDFPGFAPEEGAYMPESIRKFLSRAQEELQSVRPATLRVEDPSDSSERCRARVNGIDRGSVPAKITDVRADVVRVQIDCGGRSGRIYTFAVRPGDNALAIDPRLDRALDTSSAVTLHYLDARTAAELRIEHGKALAAALGAGHVLLVTGDRLVRVDVDRERAVGEVLLASRSVEEATGALLDATASDSVDSSHRGTAPDASGRLDGSGSGSASALAPLAWVSVGAAVLATAATAVAWGVREGAAHDFIDAKCPDGNNPDATNARTCSDALSTVKSTEVAMAVAGITAGVFAGLATLFFVLDSDSSADGGAQAHACFAGPGEIGLACRIQF